MGPSVSQLSRQRVTDPASRMKWVILMAALVAGVLSSPLPGADSEPSPEADPHYAYYGLGHHYYGYGYPYYGYYGHHYGKRSDEQSESGPSPGANPEPYYGGLGHYYGYPYYGGYYWGK